MRRAGGLLSGSTVVAAGMIGANAAAYGMTIVAARLLVPRDLGAVTALLGILQIGTVVALSLQAVTARRIAVAPDQREATIGTVARVSVAIALGTGLLTGLVTVALVGALDLGSIWPALLTGATLVPLTIMGAMAGVAQGAERWGSLAAIYLANGFGRLVFGGGAMVIDPSVTSCLIGLAIGSWAPVLAGLPQLRRRSADGPPESRRPFLREAVLGSHALLAFYALGNADALLARLLLSPHDSGLYSAGLILSKAAVFLPQFVSIVFFPLLARDETSRSRHRAVLGVAVLGLLATVATALLPRLALVAVGGDQYAEIADRLWMFVLAGSLLSIVNLLVWDALARHAHGIVTSLWIALTSLVVATVVLQVGIVGLVASVITVALALVAFVLVAPTARARSITTGA
ncbi:polysaccharide biosynthesis protein [Aeromicrobium alkaliterrae]|uniref:lipopolysaccharide biosynthesis protein n=1 Tax=Aeromicrobium alkaliterrae TaxID=302168 RepID=UPI0031D55289